MVVILLILIALPALLITIDFLKWVTTGTRLYPNGITRSLELITVIGFPHLYLWLLDERENDCCGASATFSPDHKLTVYVLISICVMAYLYSSLKKALASPVLEVVTNAILLLAIPFNILISIQMEQPLWIIGNLPICLLFIIQLVENHRRFVDSIEIEPAELTNSLERFAWKMLKLKPILKFPALLILCLPILKMITSFLMIFGQRPDAIIRAFTDTYKHGFSQLDPLCANVQCGGHFLCSVAANGHSQIVRPIRYGERAGGMIICNRQLLIANAFEELIEQRFRMTHQIIRRNYNRVGNLVRRHDHVFNNRTIADLIYLLMKPLELVFLLVLYTFDRKPEDRIAQQYLNRMDREELHRQMNAS